MTTEEKKKRGRPQLKPKLPPKAEEEEPVVEDDRPESPAKIVPRIGALAPRITADQPFSFTIRTPTLQGWNPMASRKTNDHAEEGGYGEIFMPKSTDFSSRLANNFPSPIVSMSRSAVFPLIPPPLTPEMSPSFSSHQNLLNQLGGPKFGLRRSPRFTPQTRSMSGAFSPTVFWRSPVPGMMKSANLPNLEDVPIEMPPAYFSGHFLDVDQVQSTSRSAKIGGDSTDHSPFRYSSNADDVIQDAPVFGGRKSRSLGLHDDPFRPTFGEFSDNGVEDDDKNDDRLLTKLQFDMPEAPSFQPRNALPSPPPLTFINTKIEPEDDHSQEEDIPPPPPRKQRYTSSRNRADKSDADSLGSSCHQCKSRRTKGQLAHCHNGPVAERGKRLKRPCRKKYCSACLSKFYKELMPEGSELWSCPACRNVCTCAACRKGKVRSFCQEPGRMSPATSIAVGLVYFGDFMDGPKKFKLDDIPPEIQQQADRAATAIVNQYGSNFGRGGRQHSAMTFDSSSSGFTPPSLRRQSSYDPDYEP